MILKKEFTILIADRNPHVREFLKREMMKAGYQVRLAANGREVLKWAYHHELVDLIILDSDLPDTDESSLLQKLKDRMPSLPVIIHKFDAGKANFADNFNGSTFVEKSGNSIERLKEVVFDILRRSDQQQTQIATDRDIYPS